MVSNVTTVNFWVEVMIHPEVLEKRIHFWEVSKSSAKLTTAPHHSYSCITNFKKLSGSAQFTRILQIWIWLQFFFQTQATLLLCCFGWVGVLWVVVALLCFSIYINIHISPSTALALLKSIKELGWSIHDCNGRIMKAPHMVIVEGHHYTYSIPLLCNFKTPIEASTLFLKINHLNLLRIAYNKSWKNCNIKFDRYRFDPPSHTHTHTLSVQYTVQNVLCVHCTLHKKGIFGSSHSLILLSQRLRAEECVWVIASESDGIRLDYGHDPPTHQPLTKRLRAYWGNPWAETIWVLKKLIVHRRNKKICFWRKIWATLFFKYTNSSYKLFMVLIFLTNHRVTKYETNLGNSSWSEFVFVCIFKLCKIVFHSGSPALRSFRWSRFGEN